MMKGKRLAAAAVTGALFGVIALAGPADAARCGGKPDGIVDPSGPETGTWDSPGEVIGFLNKNGFQRSSDFEAPAGLLVRDLCAGAPD